MNEENKQDGQSELEKLRKENEILHQWVDQKEDAYLAIEERYNTQQTITMRLTWLLFMLEEMVELAKKDFSPISGVILKAIAAFEDEIILGFYHDGKGYKGTIEDLIKKIEDEETPHL